MENPGNRVMHSRASPGPRAPSGSHGPERAFVSEELMLIPEDTEFPPDYVFNGRPQGAPLVLAPHSKVCIIISIQME